MGTLVCSKCGGNNISVLAWVDANTNVYQDEHTDSNDEDGCYCNDCDKNVKLILGHKYTNDFVFTNKMVITANNVHDAKDIFVKKMVEFSAEASCEKLENI